MVQQPSDVHFATVSLSTDVTLHYAERGDRKGEAIVFLHGYSDSWFSFSRVLPLLSAEYHAFALTRHVPDRTRDAGLRARTELGLYSAFTPRQAPSAGPRFSTFAAGVAADVRPFAAPLFGRVVRWRDAMPRYTIGHPARVAAMEGALRRVPGLALAGPSLRGPGLPDCVRLAHEAARATLNHLEAA